jgi:hypothetical protein
MGTRLVLYNGSMGTVIKIINGEDENPSDGSFSHHVIVDFPQYCGPP